MTKYQGMSRSVLTLIEHSMPLPPRPQARKQEVAGLQGKLSEAREAVEREAALVEKVKKEAAAAAAGAARQVRAALCPPRPPCHSVLSHTGKLVVARLVTHLITHRVLTGLLIGLLSLASSARPEAGVLPAPCGAAGRSMYAGAVPRSAALGCVPPGANERRVQRAQRAQHLPSAASCSGAAG